MDKDVNSLYQAAMKPIMEKEAKAHKRFFAQEEFERNMGRIFIITGAKRNLLEKLKKIGTTNRQAQPTNKAAPKQ